MEKICLGEKNFSKEFLKKCVFSLYKWLYLLYNTRAFKKECCDEVISCLKLCRKKGVSR